VLGRARGRINALKMFPPPRPALISLAALLGVASTESTAAAPLRTSRWVRHKVDRKTGEVGTLRTTTSAETINYPLGSRPMNRRVLALLGTLCLVLLAALAIGAGAQASRPAFGQRPVAGRYVLSRPGSSLTLEPKGKAFADTHFRLTLSAGCGPVEDAVAKIKQPFPVKKRVHHRVTEDEIDYALERVKGYRRTGHGNVQIKVGDETLTGNLFVLFIRGNPGSRAKPVEGDLELKAEGISCDTRFKGHPKGH
jgi:hypothetical protein